MRKAYLFIYYAFARHLPKSTTPIIGKASSRLRTSLCKHLFSGTCRNMNVEKGAYFGNGSRIECGDNVGIGMNFKTHNRAITFKGNLMMGEDVLFLGGGHRHDKTDVPMKCQGELPISPLVIEQDVWIGTRAMILPGCTHIGEGAIIGAGAVVTKNVEAWTIVGGNPATVLKVRK